MYKGPPYNSIGHSQEALDNHFPTLSQKLHHFTKMFKLGHFKSYGPPSDVIPRPRFEWATHACIVALSMHACVKKRNLEYLHAHMVMLVTFNPFSWALYITYGHLLFVPQVELGTIKFDKTSIKGEHLWGKRLEGGWWAFGVLKLFVVCDTWQPS